jgi:hypothetical protein
MVSDFDGIVGVVRSRRREWHPVHHVGAESAMVEQSFDFGLSGSGNPLLVFADAYRFFSLCIFCVRLKWNKV